MDKPFWRSAGKKFIENLLSIKVWVMFSLLIITSVMVFYDKLSGGAFATVNGGVISTVFALRESFKIAKIKVIKNPEDIKV